MHTAPAHRACWTANVAENATLVMNAISSHPFPIGQGLHSEPACHRVAEAEPAVVGRHHTVLQ